MTATGLLISSNAIEIVNVNSPRQSPLHVLTVSSDHTNVLKIVWLMMAATTKDIIIVGATGLIGKHITNAILHSKDKFGKITVFTSEDTVQRKSDEIEDLRNRGANIVTGDVTSDANINEVFSGHDTVVSCLGRPVIDRQLRLIELADKHADIKRVRWRSNQITGFG